MLLLLPWTKIITCRIQTLKLSDQITQILLQNTKMVRNKFSTMCTCRLLLQAMQGNSTHDFHNI